LFGENFVTGRLWENAGTDCALPGSESSHMREDVKSAFRSLRSSSNITVAALAVLTLAIGATTAIFSVVDFVALRGLPFSEQDRLVALGERSKAPSQPGAARDPDALRAVAPQNYLDWAAQQQVFDSAAAVASGWFTLRQPGARPESIVPQRVTAGFFDVLRVQPAIGHPFTAENEVAGRERVVILSDAVWRRLFGADPNILGRTIPLEDLEGGPAATGGVGYEVLGIMPSGFAYPVSSTRPTDIWIPYVVPPNQRLRDPARGAWYLQVVARLKRGVSLTQAQAQMTQVASAIEEANPVWNKNVTIGVRPLRDHIVGTRIKSWMLMLLGAVTLVLLIACANIANLLLARASARHRDTGIRAALGASRWRLVRLVLVKSLMLSAGGTIAGLCLAWWLVAVLRASMPDDLPRVAAIALDGRVLLVSSAISVLTASLVGLVPAIRSSALDPSAALKDGTRRREGISTRPAADRSAGVRRSSARALDRGAARRHHPRSVSRERASCRVASIGMIRMTATLPLPSYQEKTGDRRKEEQNTKEVSPG
jgi:putative ABC transport system permease protein